MLKIGFTRNGWVSFIIAVLFLPCAAALAGQKTPQPSGKAAVPPVIDRTLIGCWTFDEDAGPVCLDSSASGSQASPARGRPAGFDRIAGVFGRALDLHGAHALQVRGIPRRELDRISFSAWTRPTELSTYREIYRQECPNRVLFSYQDNGTVLSLGLNIGGYVECDGRMKPAQVLDGGWHHCAATFDGTFMRVYLDGEEIASLRRPGKIALSPEVPAFIGSSGGHGEFFQGSLDDLRLYADTLTPEEIALCYHSGIQALEGSSWDIAQAIQSAYGPGKTFAATLAGTRKNLVEHRQHLDRALGILVLARLKTAYPRDYDDFLAWTGASPLAYLRASGNEFHLQHAGRLVELLLEYQPLTEHQKRKQTPQERQQWQEACRIRDQFDNLRAAGEVVRFSPEWIEIILEAGRRIHLRPHVSEAVAPYVTPATPPTRQLSAAEWRDALERDWLHQADQQPAPARIRSEIQWTRELVARIGRNYPDKVDIAGELAELDGLEKKAAALQAADRQLYFKVRQVKRRIVFRNPAVDFDRVLLVDMPFPAGSEWKHETRHRLGYMAVPGGRLLVLGKGVGSRFQPGGLQAAWLETTPDPFSQVRQLMPQPPLHGSFWRPDLSSDGRTVVFCFKPHNEKSFHLYQINVDGSGLVQLTDGPFDDLDPIYLPDGRHILFSTTRAHTYVRCMPPTNAYVLARCDLDGRNIYLVSSNNEPDYLPSVMNDGRVIYTRWEYTDKPLWRAQKLWTMNPDGTQVSTFWGNQSVWPDLMKDARAIPGSRRVLFTGSAHHDWFSGSLGLIDPDRGFNFPDGLTKITADVPWPECGNGPIDPIESPRYHRSGTYRAWYSPYPLGEQDYLVSGERNGKFLLYLLDVDGNRELVYEGTHNVFHALPLKPRPRPPVLADRVAWPHRSQREHPLSGVIYSSNVYHGAPAELRGKAKHLRVLHIDPKTYTYWHKRPYISTGPVVSAVQSEGVKRILGTVPIEADGSVAFQAPPGKALHFQLLDDQYRALQTMRSFVSVMPGERRGCLGCHESAHRTPQVQASRRVDPGGTDLRDQPGGSLGKCLALEKPVRTITPPPWGEDTVSYPRYVQPVLDRYCGKCHQGDGEARQVLDLTDRPSSPIFTEPYLTLIGRPSWGQPYRRPSNPPPGFGIANMLMVEGYGQVDPEGYRTPRPLTHLSYNSPLIRLASSGRHYGVKVDFVNLQRLIAWVDAMCPYLGDEEVREIPDPEFQGVDWLAIRPRIKTAPRIIRP